MKVKQLKARNQQLHRVLSGRKGGPMKNKKREDVLKLTRKNSKFYE